MASAVRINRADGGGRRLLSVAFGELPEQFFQLFGDRPISSGSRKQAA
jgi:hypothetical protein